MIDINKTYRTRDGRGVRIYAVDGGGMHPVHGSIKTSDGWRSFTWPSDGRIACDENCGDLIEVKPRIQKTVWLSFWSNNYIEATREKPEWRKMRSRNGDLPYACVKVEIDCEEGEGL
jgi:hypothetical protein